MTGPTLAGDALDAAIARAKAAIEGARMPERAEHEERKQRHREAVSILRRLPRFLQESEQVLTRRIGDSRLAVAASTWRWGSGNLVLLGPTRIGKSTAAAAIMTRLVTAAASAGGDPWYATATMHWFGAGQIELAHKQHPLGRGEAHEIATANTASLLVLDDLGWDRDPGAVSYVLDQRMQRCLPTIITSGRTRDQLSEKYGAAIVRRMVESGGRKARIVDCFQPEPEAVADSKTRAAGG
jgi:DNA replication protein DnaC